MHKRYASFQNRKIKSIDETKHCPAEKMYKGQKLTVCRIGIMQFVDQWISKISGKVLDLGCGNWSYVRDQLQPHIKSGKVEYVSCDFCGKVDIIADIHELSTSIAANTYDYVFCLDVFEHIPEPWIAVKELETILKPGGVALLTSPFNYQVHRQPGVFGDYWRINEDGWYSLLKNFIKVTVTAQGDDAFPHNYVVVASKKV